VSGELRGDLRAQGRTIAEMLPVDTTGVVPNKTMTWGVVVKNGLAYVNDMVTGLWVVRIVPRRVVPEGIGNRRIKGSDPLIGSRGQSP
jgi:hypothetical protein